MWGDFQVIILYCHGGLIDKKFDVKKGGSPSWERSNESTTEFQPCIKNDCQPCSI
jgi:hypothetical protein